MSVLVQVISDTLPPLGKFIAHRHNILAIRLILFLDNDNTSSLKIKVPMNYINMADKQRIEALLEHRMELLAETAGDRCPPGYGRPL